VHKSTDSQARNIPGSGVSATGFLNKEFRLLDRYELQADLVEALEKTDRHTHLVPKVAACHKSFRHKRCDQSHDWAKPFNSCSVRVCPHCAYRRSEILAGRIQDFIVGREGLRYAVLSETSTADFKQGKAQLWKSWERLRRSVAWKRKVRGCVVAFEVTYNSDEGTWHPHLNVLMEGEYFPQEELKLLWVKATQGCGQIVWIEKADAGTAHELIKYVTKVADLLDDPEVLDEFLCGIERCRLIRTYGTFRGIAVKDEDNPEDVEECPDCGSKCIIDLGFVPAHQIGFDFQAAHGKGAFRVKRKQCEVDDALRRNEEFVPGFFEASGHPRPKTKLDHELARFRSLITSVAATSRTKGATPTWQQPQQ
jgi:hypothetical protein